MGSDPTVVWSDPGNESKNVLCTYTVRSPFVGRISAFALVDSVDHVSALGLVRFPGSPAGSGSVDERPMSEFDGSFFGGRVEFVS